jgi:hypothetical protein
MQKHQGHIGLHGKFFLGRLLSPLTVTPGFKDKSNAYSMCAQELSLHTYHI